MYRTDSPSCKKTKRKVMQGMKTLNEIMTEVKQTFSSKWSQRNGLVVPEPEDIKLGNDGVNLDATILYADMCDSTSLVDGYKDWFAAEIYKSYLLSACHVIRNHGGSIVSFDGDRVMAVFIGKSKNSTAAKVALQINAVVRQINKVLPEKYPRNTFTLHHSIGIDTGEVLAARTGIRNSNDLVWVGAAANHAAKLCEDATNEKPLVISEKVYSLLNDSSKIGGSSKINMWEKSTSAILGGAIYKSSWYWDF